MRWRDTRSGYGWISIALHWLTAILVLTMWTLGTMSQTDVQDDAAWYAHLHMTIGVSAYLLLWGRILWRFAVGHPGPHPGQSALLFPVAKAFHYLFLMRDRRDAPLGPADGLVGRRRNRGVCIRDSEPVCVVRPACTISCAAFMG